MRTKIDLVQLESEIKLMTHDSRLYKVLKKCLKLRGNWKDLPRGSTKQLREQQIKMARLMKGK